MTRCGMWDKEKSRMTSKFLAQAAGRMEQPPNEGYGWRRLTEDRELSMRHVIFEVPGKRACMSSRQAVGYMRTTAEERSGLGIHQVWGLGHPSCSKISEMEENQKHILVSRRPNENLRKRECSTCPMLLTDQVKWGLKTTAFSHRGGKALDKWTWERTEGNHLATTLT